MENCVLHKGSAHANIVLKRPMQQHNPHLGANWIAVFHILFRMLTQTEQLTKSTVSQIYPSKIQWKINWFW
jgi:hypothetical protein